ncbi:MAG: hypothetical protein OXB94_07485 [Nitrospira sp.]|nr:hypothetical protein [Nitrospira sp.]
MFKRISYEEDLNARQKENFNFQKVASTLADYGFNCIRLSDDWQGADFLACHIDGKTFMKIQLKGRLTFDKKFRGKDIYIAFNECKKCKKRGQCNCNEGRKWYIYPHDELLKKFFGLGLLKGRKAWDNDGKFTFPRLSIKLKELMVQYAK